MLNSTAETERNWRIEGTKNGRPIRCYIAAFDHNDAVRKASRMVILVRSCVLVEGPAEVSMQTARAAALASPAREA